VKFEVFNGNYVGTVTWTGPHEVALDVPDETHRRFFERFFASEDSVMTGAMGTESMSSGRRDESEDNFRRAMYELVAYRYRVEPANEST
jgi:hypothetical protein